MRSDRQPRPASMDTETDSESDIEVATVSNSAAAAAGPVGSGASPATAAAAPLWVQGEFTLLIHGRAGRPHHVQRVRQPFALMGRLPQADVCLIDPHVSGRHVFLHLDHRGLFGVDLGTRTGTRFGSSGRAFGWLAPGQFFEVAGRRIDLLSARLDGEACHPRPCATNLLADTEPADAARLLVVTLVPRRATGEPPRVLRSELVFLGRSPACGIAIPDAGASRVHGAVLRTAQAAYVIDLLGRGSWLNGQPLRGAAALADGDVLTLGPVTYKVRVLPPEAAGSTAAVPRLGTTLAIRPRTTSRPRPPTTPSTDLATTPTVNPPPPPPAPPATNDPNVLVAELVASHPLPDGLVPAESSQALLAWLVGALQAGQGELIRRQNDFQMGLLHLVREIQRDHADLLSRHLDRMEAINRELAELRDEMHRRFDPRDNPSPMANATTPPSTSASPSPLSSTSAASRAANAPRLPEPPRPALPLAQERDRRRRGAGGAETPASSPAAPASSPAAPAAAPAASPRPHSPPPDDPEAATAWLLQRVNQLEQESRSTWKDLIGRLTSLTRRS